MSALIQPVVLCGGAGTRLWPASRGTRAKQFLALESERSLFARTLDRVVSADFLPLFILCGADHVDAVRSHPEAEGARLIVESIARNTAAAIALAVAAADPAQLLLVMPSDHIIADLAAFHAAIDVASILAREDWLVTFGIAPVRPETGFGYIASGAPLGESGYAVMERHDRVAVVPVSMGWSDVGSWEAVHGLAAHDDAGNACAGDVFLHDSRGCLVRPQGKRVSLVGVQDLAVIVDGDDILVMPLSRSQDVRAAASTRQ